MTREPLRYLLHPIVLLAFAAAAQAFIDGANTRGILIAVLGVLVAAATEYARAHVTPAARIRDVGPGQAGYTLVELVVGVLLVLILAVILLRLL